VSTAPNIGTVILDSTIGIAIARTLLFVISCFKNFTIQFFTGIKKCPVP